MKQIKNGQSLFHKNLVRDDYTVPFLNDEVMKKKLDTVINLKEPNAQKGALRATMTKFPRSDFRVSPSSYDDKAELIKIEDKHRKSRIKDPNYYTTRVDDSDDPDASTVKIQNKRKVSKFKATDPSLYHKKREEQSKSMMQELSPESVLMPPVSLLDRKFNNYSKVKFNKAQKDLSFPMNPAFISDPRFNKLPPLQDLITFC